MHQQITKRIGAVLTLAALVVASGMEARPAFGLGGRVTCPAGATAEGEPCGADLNGGCNMVTPTFEVITPDAVICGSVWWDGATRDTDWYEIEITEPTYLSLSVVADFPVLIGLIELSNPGSGDCGEWTGEVNPELRAAAGEQIWFTTPLLPPGRHWLAVAPQFASPVITCEGGSNEYVATFTASTTLISSFQENLETMMHAQGDTAQLIARVYGVDAGSPLNFVSTTDDAGKSFTCALEPGSTYLNQGITIDLTGTFNESLVTWEMALSGQLGGDPFGGTGTGVFEHASRSSIIEILKAVFEWLWEHDFQIFDSHTKTIIGGPAPPIGGSMPTAKYTVYTVFGIEVGRKIKGQDDSGPREIPDRGGGVRWDWRWQSSSLDIGPFTLLCEGSVVEATGAGTSVVRIVDPWPDTWSDNLDLYAPGPLLGQGGWEAWGGDPLGGDFVAATGQSFSTPHALEIDGLDDAVHSFTPFESPDASFVVQQYIPLTASGSSSLLILLNSYDGGGAGTNWSTQLRFDPDANVVISEPEGATLPLVKGDWAEIWVAIDFDANTQMIFYNEEHLSTKSWTEGLSGGGVLQVAAVNLFGGGSTYQVYYDDFRHYDPWGYVPPPVCLGDLTVDGTVDVFDLLELLTNWGTSGTGAAIAAPTNTVDVFDLLDLLAAWGACN